MKGDYTLIVPALDRTGPVNVAVDIGRAAKNAGWRVRLLYLTPCDARDDLEFSQETRRFRLSDFWCMQGVVHTHCLRPDLLGLFLAFNRRLTLVTTLHNFFLVDVGFDKSRLFVGVAWQVWKRALKSFGHVICISEAMRRYYNRCLPDQPLHVAYNFRAEPPAIATDAATLVWIEQRRSFGDVVLSFVGSLSKRKNILGLVDALAKVPGVSLIICGHGPQFDQVLSTIHRLGLDDRVRLQGYVTVPSSITRLVDALVLPSHAEGFPLAVLEAASVGVPALMSNIAVHRELARLGFGVTFDHRCYSDLLEKSHLLRLSQRAPSEELIALWLNGFSPEVGFARYESIIMKRETIVKGTDDSGPV